MLWSIVLLPLLGALVPPFAERSKWLTPAGAAGVVTLAALLPLLALAPDVFAGKTLAVSWPWIPALGLTLSFRLDGLALLFALLILVIGLLVILYARYYLAANEPKGRFFAYILLFMGAMLGIVLAGNLLLMLMFWELTSLSSFLLIGFWKHEREARRGARLALAVTAGGGLALLAGILLLGHIVGSFELSVVLASGELVRAHPLYAPTLVLILLGAFTKSAQFPFHFWLPHAMSAPTPVSAYLHSATMVKAGVFLIARLFPTLAGTDLWFVLVSGAGVTTLLLGAYHALFQHDLKGLLAYSTISHLGLITLLFGLGTPLGEVAGVFHIINHATFKASLFMAAGIIDHEAGTRDMRQLNGLFTYMPYTATLAMVAAAAMAGVPLLNGFLSKEMFFTETVTFATVKNLSWAPALAALVAGVFSVAYSLRFIHDVFFNGEPVDLPKLPHEPPRWMKVPVELLVVICLLVGLFPGYTVAPLLAVAASSVLGGALPEYQLAMWHGFNLPLAMSLVAMGGGAAVYAVRHRLFALHARVFTPLSGRKITETGIEGLYRAAANLTAWLDNGSLQRYLAALVLAALVIGSVPFAFGSVSLHANLTPLDWVTLLGSAALVLAALSTALFHRQRLLALVFMSVAGLMVSLAFVRLSAPDLALTQLLVEVATILLLLLVLFFLPPRTPAESSAGRQLRDVTTALLAGLAAGGLTWAMLMRPFSSISDYYLEQSVPGGGGTNVVNVILVDFRGFDTFGEITVLAIAAVGILAMLGGLTLPVPQADAAGKRWARVRHPLILSVTTRPLIPLAILVGMYLLLRGHNQPGGGFIGGLVVAIALVLQYLAGGSARAQRHLPSDFRPLIGLGLLVAALTGVVSLLFGFPFLTSTFTHVDLPIIGEFELASAMSFDVGVLLAVVGTVLLILAGVGALNAPEDTPGEREAAEESE